VQDEIFNENIDRLPLPFHIISYCIRPLMDDIESNKSAEGKFYSFKFNELDRLNVTIQDLIRWSIPFDLVET
jgi:hypothetical protein